jgi:hypothetical protein
MSGIKMYFELFDLFLLTAVSISIYYWLAAQKVREFALIAARIECKRLNLQLLDGSVSLKKIAPKRLANGQLSLQREYHFDFSATGEERYRGMIIMIGNKILRIHLEPHRIV